MLFCSPIFLFLFLPIVLFGYYILKNKYRNFWLLFASLIFFAWGGVSYTLLIIVSVITNFFFGLKVQKNINNSHGYYWLYAGVSINLLILCFFKYTNFLIDNINTWFNLFSDIQIPDADIILPIGISFYTFHSISYLVDIYRKKSEAQRNIFDMSLYITMFSQLIAGPIIRYSDIWKQLNNRKHSLAKFSSGAERFIIGLGKKVLLANVFAKIADNIFSYSPLELSAVNAWLGIICYTMQIYCDFSGYSDMAIGLGRMFGFEFIENFNFPYIAKSVKEFWRRWHISLSSFFRDYVYIPMGGSRKGEIRTYYNLIIVFFLTGFWHGASWTFIIWGLFHGFFMIIERLGFEKILNKVWSPIANFYTLMVVLFAWVLFRSDNLSFAFDYWQAMFRFNLNSVQKSIFYELFNSEFCIALIISLLGAFSFYTKIESWVIKCISHNRYEFKMIKYIYQISSILILASILILCTIYLISDSYNPFIYYRF